MTNSHHSAAAGVSVEAVIVEEQIELALPDLCRACGADPEQVIALVGEGVLQPTGRAPKEWRFGGPSLTRARAALRLVHDLELGLAGVALVLDLLEEIETLRSRLRRVGAQ